MQKFNQTKPEQAIKTAKKDQHWNEIYFTLLEFNGMFYENPQKSRCGKYSDRIHSTGIKGKEFANMLDFMCNEFEKFPPVATLLSMCIRQVKRRPQEETVTASCDICSNTGTADFAVIAGKEKYYHLMECKCQNRSTIENLRKYDQKLCRRSNLPEYDKKRFNVTFNEMLNSFSMDK